MLSAFVMRACADRRRTSPKRSLRRLGSRGRWAPAACRARRSWSARTRTTPCAPSCGRSSTCRRGRRSTSSSWRRSRMSLRRSKALQRGLTMEPAVVLRTRGARCRPTSSKRRTSASRPTRRPRSRPSSRPPRPTSWRHDSARRRRTTPSNRPRCAAPCAGQPRRNLLAHDSRLGTGLGRTDGHRK